MDDPSLMPVELALAQTGNELAPALEAAQYARFIKPEEPDTEAEAEAMTGFVEAFSACTEVWEAGSATDRTAALTALGTSLEALERLGLYVHGGAAELDYTPEPGRTVKMPVAIVTVTRNDMQSGVVMVPTEVEAAAESEGPTH